MKSIVCFGFCLLFCACSTSQDNKLTAQKFLNEDEFVGLEVLGKSYGDIKLDYELDGVNGELIAFSSCLDVEKTKESDVVTSQFHLLMLMKLNCQAAKFYHHAPNNSKSYLTKTPSENWVKNLPALAVPDLGGESLANLNGVMIEHEPQLKINSISDKSVQVLLSGDLDVTYVILASGDFDSDGDEDLLIRLDWRITSAFGKGFELLMLSQKVAGSTMEVVWRSSAAD